MKLLLDTHAFLWLMRNDKRLSETAKAAFSDKDNELFFSAASYWEICIKQSLGKLALSADWQATIDRELAANQIKWLDIAKVHCQGVVYLPMLHRDPFDRLLIAQARAEGMVLLTNDNDIGKYKITTLW